jgi:hypothetical protein
MTSIIGRVVEVRTQYLNGPGHITEIHYVAVDDDSEALRIVKAHIKHLDEAVSVVGHLSPSTVKAMGMTHRQVRTFS